jgi:hypothetical protein
MAKNSILLSNDDGNELLTDIANLSYDDATGHLSVNDISASQFVLTGAVNAVLLNQSGQVIARNAASNSGSVLLTDGSSWVVAPMPSNLSVGTAGSDLSGSYPTPIFKNISNIRTGSLPISRGGLSGSGISSIPSGSLIIANGTGNLIAVSTASYDGSGVWVLGATNSGTSWTSVTASAVARSVNLQHFTCSIVGTSRTVIWTKSDPNHQWARVMLQAGGGGGGGAATLNGNNASGGGGGGFTDMVVYLGNISTATITVGAGGVGSSVNTVGSSGISSSFSASNIFVSACGGTGGTNGNVPGAGGVGLTYSGGAGGGATTSAPTNGAGGGSSGASGGGAGSYSATVPEKIAGTAGQYVAEATNTVASNGNFKSGLFNYEVPFGFGTGGSGGALNSGTSPNGVYGGGGGGAGRLLSGSPNSGGRGGDGFVIILSY